MLGFLVAEMLHARAEVVDAGIEGQDGGGPEKRETDFRRAGNELVRRGVKLVWVDSDK